MPENSEKTSLIPSVKILGLIALVGAVILARDVLLLAFLGLLLAVIFSYPVELFSRWMSRGFAVLLTLALFVGLSVGLGHVTIPTVSRELQTLTRQVPDAVDRVDQWYTRARRTEPMVQIPQGQAIAERLKERAAKAIESGVSALFPAAIGVAALASTAVLIVVLAGFLAHQPGLYRKGLRSLVPVRYEPQFDEAYRRVGSGLRHWIGGILVSMAIMGGFTGLGLWVAGIENWLLLGVLTFLGTFVPYLGAIASAVPGLLIGLSQSWGHFVSACTVYLAVHMVEGYLVQPLIMKRAVEIRPAMLLIGQAVFASIFGILGVIVATPLMVCIQELVGYFYVERALGKEAVQVR